ncbi:hypothetical protein [Streptomyces mirabilis]|uniref:hypothetical protein n=1 Tax=Streptomyces mirabilis TaxID=68239 RepID=UPI0036A9FCB0
MGKVGECRPKRNGATFLAFLKKPVKPHAGKEMHIVLDNLSARRAKTPSFLRLKTGISAE